MRASAKWTGALPAAALVAAAVAVYANGLDAPFLLDDYPAIVDNAAIRQLWPPAAVLAPPADAPGAGRPVVGLSLAFNYALGGLAVRGYHLFNLAVHVLATLALFGVLRRTLRLSTIPERYRAHAGGLAFACALLWTVHPLSSECVNYVTQRSESLMGLFLLLTLYCVVRSVASRGTGRWQAVAVVCCALGMASKEVMVVAPVLVLLYDRAFLSAGFLAAVRSRGGLYAGLISTWLLLAALILTGPDYRSMAMGYSLHVGALDYAWVQGGIVLGYLRLALWPHPLVFDYGEFEPVGPGAAWPAVLTILLLLGLTAVALWRRPRLGFLGAWFFLILAPTSSFVPLVSEVGAERRMYLPLAAVVVAVVLAGHTVLARQARRRGSLAAGTGIFLVLAAVSALAAVTVARNAEYADAVRLWTRVAELRPRSLRAHNNLGGLLLARGDLDGALRHYRLALELNPDSAEAHNNVGVVFQNRGDLESAALQYERAIESRPDYPEAHSNLGVVLQMLGRLDEAERHYREALRFDPDNAEAHSNLGIALHARGQVDAARLEYERALQLDPHLPEAHANLGAALLVLGRKADAIAHLREALRLDPTQDRARRNLQRAQLPP